ncbi:zinc finger protein 830 [Podarcis raffonei]|uniref:zinc finger protein 830 n=1 Tax=Podarcis raffonei TaxID=65483 RepID=UPI0023292296|nr:zinc finger protein 830 [Podarcis raffonei]
MAASGPAAGRPRGRPGAAAASVGQEELRRLMRAKQREAAAGKKKRVDSPFARYNSLGNLSCSLCNMPVKSELLWQTHVLGKQHKEKVEQLRNLKQSVPGPIPDTSSSLKRKTTNTESPELKKAKDSSDHPQTLSSGLPADFFGKSEQAEADKASCKASSGGLLLGDSEEEEEEEAEEMAKEIQDNSSKPPLSSTVQHTATLAHPQKVDTTALPSDYSDNKTLAAPLVSHSGSIQKAEIQEKVVERKENTAEALPEGFFDDPEVDAKVRKVDAPKDQMDKEWDEFQKAMRQVNTISEAIVAEEDEEGRLDRQIGEIDEQIECFRRVEQLRDRQEVLKDKLKEAMRLRAAQVEDGDTGSDDEGELHDLLSQDWRAKGTSL